MAAIFKISERFTETVVDDEIVIMRLDNGEFFSLTGSAAAAWQLIDGSRDRDALVTELANEFGADKDQVAADIEDFLARLKKSGLLATG